MASCVHPWWQTRAPVGSTCGQAGCPQAARAMLALPSRKEQVPLLTRLGVTPRRAHGKRPNPLWTTCHMSQRQATLIQQQEALKTVTRCGGQRRPHRVSRDARTRSVCSLGIPANVAAPSKPCLPSQAARSGGRPARFAGRPHRGRAPGIACMHSWGYHVRVANWRPQSGHLSHQKPADHRGHVSEHAMASAGMQLTRRVAQRRTRKVASMQK